MEITAIPLARLQSPSRSRVVTRLPDFLALMKPRVMLLAVFTAFVGLMIAPGSPRSASWVHCNSRDCRRRRCRRCAQYVVRRRYRWHDDAHCQGPIPRGTVSRVEALVFGIVLAGGAVAALALAVNLQAAALLAFTIFFYVAVYTVWLKRSTPQNIVIGGAAGALPPVIGWAAATGEVALEPFILFLIVFLWTPPHFWALALNRSDEYARAGVPMLPVVAGRAETTRQILIYSVLLAPTSVLPWALGFAGTIYGATAIVCGAILIVLAFQLSRSREPDRRAAHRLFAFSILYLFVLFAALLASSGANRWSSTLSARAAPIAAGPGQAHSPAAHPIRIARSSTSLRADEV